MTNHHHVLWQKPAIEWMARYEDGPGFGYVGAKIACAKCDGWKALECPHGCGVRVISTAKEDAEEFRERMDREGAERRAYREERRRAREEAA
jgi:hypothetical protein